MQFLLGKLLPDENINERSSVYLMLQTIDRGEVGRNEPVVVMLAMYMKKYFSLVPHVKDPRVFTEINLMEKRLIDLQKAIEIETGRRPQPMIRSAMGVILLSMKQTKLAFPHLVRPPPVTVLEKKKEYLMFLGHQLEMDRLFLERYAIDVEKTCFKNAATVLKLKAELHSANKHWLKWNGEERRAIIELAAELEKEHVLLQKYLRAIQQPYAQLRDEVENALARLDSQADPVRFLERQIVSITHRYDLMYFNDFEAKIKDPTDWMLRLAERTAAIKEPKCKVTQEPECNNCTSPVSLRPCSRCRTVWYCGKPCQTQHWKEGGHKRFCVAVADRVPSDSVPSDSVPSDGLPSDRVKSDSVPSTTAPASEEKCVVCLDPLKSGERLSLGCGHTLHTACMADLISFGVARACPTCRHGL
jgi:hypothetical protein